MSDEYALVTGATTGIGAEFAELLAAEGKSLVVVARDAKRLEDRAENLGKKYNVKVKALAADLSKPDSAREIFEELKRKKIAVSILINNAGSGVYGRFADTVWERELAMLQLNMVSLVQLTKLFLRPMLDRKEGRILNVASTTSFQPGPWLALYSASKAFVHSFSCALAVEVEGTGVTVTTLYPGATKTEFQPRAGMKHSATSSPMLPGRVAQIGLDAMMAGRPTAIAGSKNKLMIAVSRRASIMGAARMAEKFNRGR